MSQWAQMAPSNCRSEVWLVRRRAMQPTGPCNGLRLLPAALVLRGDAEHGASPVLESGLISAGTAEASSSSAGEQVALI
jgi:hypothetical protein